MAWSFPAKTPLDPKRHLPLSELEEFRDLLLGDDVGRIMRPTEVAGQASADPSTDEESDAAPNRSDRQTNVLSTWGKRAAPGMA